MKPAYLLLIAMMFLSFSSAQNAKTNVAVLDLDPTGIAPTEAQFLTDRLRTELFETGAFQVVERDKMNAILNEQGFQRTGCTSVECAVEIGQLLNVQSIVAGSIGKIEDIYSISLRLINVQSGAIIKTATKDYRGKLSEVLTDVIPEIASVLAKKEEKAGTKSDETKAQEIRSTASASRKFGLMLKVGGAFLGYTSDVNKSISDYPYPEKIDMKYSNHSHIGLEVNYFLSGRWQLKLGLGVESMLNTWKNEKYFFEHLSRNIRYEKMYQFVNPYVGINYYLVQNPGKYEWYLGADLGSMGLNVNTSYKDFDNNNVIEKDYSYSTLCFKLATGFGYFISRSFKIGFELVLQATGSYDLSNQGIEGIDFTDDIIFKEDILMWKEITASGVQLNFTLSYFL